MKNLHDDILNLPLDKPDFSKGADPEVAHDSYCQGHAIAIEAAARLASDTSEKMVALEKRDEILKVQLAELISK